MSGPWTKGPWTSDGNRDGFVRAYSGPAIYAANFTMVAETLGGRHDDEIAANATLIAAAPELAEVLQRLADYIGALPATDHALAAYEEARALLTRIGGETK